MVLKSDLPRDPFGLLAVQERQEERDFKQHLEDLQAAARERELQRAGVPVHGLKWPNDRRNRICNNMTEGVQRL
jgi:hypothetical protein